MIVKSHSSSRQDDVSVIDRGDGFSEVWLRRNHVEDAADNGPEGPATAFWTCDEVSFVARGQTSVAEVTARFDELWEAHRDDGRPVEEVAAEAMAAADAASKSAAEAKEAASQAGTDPQVMAFARMAVLPMAADMTVSEGASVSILWPERHVGDAVRLGDFFWYGGELYRCNQPELTITAGQEPDKNLPTLYGHVSVAADGVLVWDADDLTGAPDIYNTGVKVHYPDADGPVYVSGRDGNTSSPGTDEWWTLAEG